MGMLVIPSSCHFSSVFLYTNQKKTGGEKVVHSLKINFQGISVEFLIYDTYVSSQENETT